MEQTADMRYRQLSDQDRNAMAARHLPTVRRIVWRVSAHLPPEVDREDLVGAGVVGLMEALNRYDPDSGNTFMTYAAFRIRGAVISEMRSRDIISRGDRRKIREMRETARRLESDLGRAPEDTELAGALETDLKEIHRLRHRDSMSVFSMEDLGIGNAEDRFLLADSLLQDAPADALTLTRLKEIRNAVSQAVGNLPEKQRMVISLYYEEEMTMKEIGGVLEVTESRVSQLHSQAIGKIRAVLGKDDLTELPAG